MNATASIIIVCAEIRYNEHSLIESTASEKLRLEDCDVLVVG